MGKNHDVLESTEADLAVTTEGTTFLTLEAGSMVQADPCAKFADLRPMKSPPRLYHFFGFGLYLHGDRDFDMETQSFVRTLCLCVLYIPVLALRSYRVAPSVDGWSYLGVTPVSRSARLLSLASAALLLGGAGFIGARAYLNSPIRVATRKLAEVDRLFAIGKVRDAVVVLADVAVGPTEHATASAKRLAKLLMSDSSIKDQAGLGDMFGAAVKVQQAGRWPGSAQAIQKRALEVAKSTALKDPRGAVTILDSVAPLAPLDQSTAEIRQDLLEKIVAADPRDLAWATRLALTYESKGDLDRCQKILEPLRAQLGESEGARVLGLADAKSDRIDKALPLLRAYTTGRLERLGKAEEKLRSLYRSSQERILDGLKNERALDFEYNRYRNAGESGREKMLIAYIEGKLKGDPEIAKAQEALIAESGVTPTALELGLLLVQHAQAQGDPQARQTLLAEAEATFLAVSRIAGDQEEYQLSMAQVYYWQGKHAQGRKILDQVLAARQRDPELLLQVTGLLRSVGSNSEARVLAEEGYGKAPPGPIKNGCAVIRGLLGDDLEDRILWLKRGDTNNPNTQAILAQDLAAQAMQKGNEAQAIVHLKSAISTYDSMPESAGALNNAWIALSQLARLTGDSAARRRATAMIEKAAALDPGSSLTLSNASTSMLEEGLRDIIGPSIDLSVLKDQPDLSMFYFLAKDERAIEALVARVRTHRDVNRALAMMQKVVLLSSRNPGSYEALKQVLVFRRDADGLRKLFGTLSRTELDLAGQAKRATEVYAGKLDDTMKTFASSAVKLAESSLPVARAKGGPTFALGAAEVVKARMTAAIYGITVDASATVALAEEAFASSSSLASRWYFHDALLFRAAERMTAADQRFARLRERTRRSVSFRELIAGALSRDGPLKELALNDADVVRAVKLLRESYTACPEYASGPESWAIIQSRFPEVAAAVAKTYLANDADLLADEIGARLRPYDPGVTLKAYLRARMTNQEQVAKKIVEDAKSRGMQLPFD
jgi:hypothetical protein